MPSADACGGQRRTGTRRPAAILGADPDLDDLDLDLDLDLDGDRDLDLDLDRDRDRGRHRFARGWARSYTSASRFQSRCVYRCVVESDAWPSSSWIPRRSAPFPSRWVAKQCRST